MKNLTLSFMILCSLVLFSSCAKDEVVAPIEDQIFVPSEELTYNGDNFSFIANFDEQYGDSAYTVIKILSFTSHNITSTHVLHVATGSYLITRNGKTYDLFQFYGVIMKCNDENGLSIKVWLKPNDVLQADKDRDGVYEDKFTVTDPRKDPNDEPE